MMHGNKNMRTFVIVFQEALPSRSIDLDDLPSQGRLDVLCRAITSTLFLSNGFRRDTLLVAVFERTRSMLVIRGNEARGLNPDERSLGGTLRAVFSGESWPGVWYGPGTLKTLLKELQESHIIVMDPRGKSVVDHSIPRPVTFVLGDHLGFSQKSRELLAHYPHFSLGVDVEYLTSQTIAILHYLCDRTMHT